MRRFHLVRHEDVSGCSGCGVVAEGVIWSGGHVSLTWLLAPYGETRYACLADVERIHGHEGRTQVVMLDEAAA